MSDSESDIPRQWIPVEEDLSSGVDPCDVKFSHDQFLYSEDYCGHFDLDDERASTELCEASEGELSWRQERPIYPIYLGEEKENELEDEEDGSLQSSGATKTGGQELTSSRHSPRQQDQRRKSLFVYSSPNNFPDIKRARKSAFGSIFLRTGTHVAEEMTLLKTIAGSSYSMLQSILLAFEKIIASASADTDRMEMTQSLRQSVQKTLEDQGIVKSYSDGSIHWDIYPISQNYLFTIRVGGLVHQTRHLSRIEDRIVMGPDRKLRLPHSWSTGSVWSGFWNSLGMSGLGAYNMPHGVLYSGKMHDGIFHDANATLVYPNNFKAVHCVYHKGKMISCQFQFPDSLMHSHEDWDYCKFPDRRFWSEVQHGLKPAKIAQKTQLDPPRRIPPGCYDTSDGFYDPKTLMLTSPSGELLRVPVCEEDKWIKKYCRKGFLEPADYRPDLFENWFDYDEDLTQSIINQQANFRAKKITYDELQQFYADRDLLPSWSKYKKRITPSKIEIKEHLSSITDPKPIRPPRLIKKFKGHNLSVELNESVGKETPSIHSFKALSPFKQSRSLLKFADYSTHKVAGSQTSIGVKSSKILGEEQKTLDGTEGSSSGVRRTIPEKYLKYQPILRPPFQTLDKPRCSPKERSQREECLSRRLSESSDTSEEITTEVTVEKRNREKFMKKIILEVVTDILIEERERERQRLMWGKKVPKKETAKRKGSSDKCLTVLEELFQSIPDKEEYCDSDPSRTCDLRKLAEDKHGMLKYWGKRIFLLEFDDEPKDLWLSKRDRAKI